MSKVLTVALVGGGLLAAGGLVYLAVRDSGDAPGRPRGVGGAQTLGDVIARVGGTAVAQLGRDLGSWTAAKIAGVFSNSTDAAQDPNRTGSVFV